jgi:hypothetical protein
MITVISTLFGELLFVTIFYEVKLTTNNGFNFMFEGLINELENPEHIAMIGNGHGRHTILRSLGHHFLDVGGSVEQAELSMNV